ncbi:polyprenol reductase [Periophthalmus magnuspinnatus]|uniref:polyprenol reductase n=1 Tax=Periophthalmus magnuspinnatus TaxID=409849 RepID=UPI00145BF196|nr:polyprenol reductase [Periophthalmus magnuspinnatus]
MVWSQLVSFSIIDVLWAFLATCFIVACGLYKVSSHLPKKCQKLDGVVIFQDLIRYGKTKQNLKRDDWLRVFDVPKRWFWHFYAVSVCWSGSLLFFYLNSIFLHHPLPSWLTWSSSVLIAGKSSSNPEGNVPQMTTLLLLLLLWLHSLRRLLECCFVSIFSDGVIHVVHYLFGLVYYIVLGLTALCSEHMVKKDSSTLFSQVNWCHILGCALFILTSLLQHQSMVLLAKLRSGKSGNVETMVHKMPTGGGFELVSCPHYFAEVLIYTSLWVASGGLFTWGLVSLYVFFNQALAAQLCHDFYKCKFESYPRQRKAFIPFVL